MIQTFFTCVREEQVERLKEWMTELTQRREEVLETFENEGTRQEQVFLIPPNEGYLMVHVIERDDPTAGRRAFLESQLPVDVQHKEVMDAVTLKPAVTEVLLDLCAPATPAPRPGTDAQ